jgi:adenosylmethionine-8-amino-7-oxononanoate aminotransferase
MPDFAQLDHRHIWHPFTQMRDWLRHEPIVIVSGQGALLRDAKGREYLDANSSIWTNLHGHNHPKINAAIERQLKKIAHSSALGLANAPASQLAEKLVNAANPAALRQHPLLSPRRPLNKVFFSDDGSTAMEVALKLAYEFARRSGRRRRPRFLSMAGAYHGDTIGAVSLGHIELFHKAYAGLLFKSDAVMAPYCYRCPFNRARPERGDAREYRKCQWECVDLVEKKLAVQKRKGAPYAAMIVEPLMQGAAGMIPQPKGWLRRVAELVRGHGTQLIADEVMTGFGRTGIANVDARHRGPLPSPERTGVGKNEHPDDDGNIENLFACHHEGVQPDYLALAKGLTGGYLPMAATLTTQAIFDAFLGEYWEFKTFFHGHSYSGNQLGAAAALASLGILQSPASIRVRSQLEDTLREELPGLWRFSNVGDIRQVGLIAGVELVKDWRTRVPFDLRERAGMRVCEAMARRGVLTRPIGNVLVLMPPFCTNPRQARRLVETLGDAIAEVFGAKPVVPKR